MEILRQGDGVKHSEPTTMEDTMKITVKIHEKRAHPFEMGHRDAEVGFEEEVTADIFHSRTGALTIVATKAVNNLLDKWEADVRMMTVEQLKQDQTAEFDRAQNRRQVPEGDEPF